MAVASRYCVFLCFSAYERVLWSQVFVKALPTTADSLNDV